MSNFILSVHDIDNCPDEKFHRAIEELAKAAGVRGTFTHEPKAEPTPYRALYDLTEAIIETLQKDLKRFYDIIKKKWLDVEKAVDEEKEFKIDGRTFINPKTGRALTIKQWNVIRKDLERIFGRIYRNAGDSMLKQAIALGKILSGMDPKKRLTSDYKAMIDDIKWQAKATTKDPLELNIRNWGDIHTGELIQDMTQRSVRDVATVIMNAQKNKVTARKLASELYDTFGVLNRDWRRIVETETATNFNSGYLITELGARKKDEKYIFMMGVSASGACDFCRNEVNGQIVVLLEDAPGPDDHIEIDGKEYVAIWPGKNNFGRKRSNWWVSAGTQHPHCRCSWTRYFPQITEKYADEMRDVMQQIEKDAEARRNAEKNAG